MDKQEVARELVKIAKELVGADKDNLRVIEDIVETMGKRVLSQFDGVNNANIEKTSKKPGYILTGWIDLNFMVSTGQGLPGGSSFEKVYDKKLKDTYKELSNHLRSMYPEFRGMKGDILHEDAEDMDMGQEYEEMEEGMFDGETIWIEVGAMLLSDDKCQAFVGVTLGEKSRYDWIKQIDFTVSDDLEEFESDLKKNMVKLAKQV